MQAPHSTPEPEGTPRLTDLAMHWQEAWNRHDMDELSASIAPDVDFVTVTGLWLQGRAAFLDQHKTLHRTQMRDSKWTTLACTARLLHAGLALQHVEWRIEGDRNLDGTPRSPRRGVFTWVVLLDARPSIRAAHNTNLAAHVTHRLAPQT
jgi:uncharacterized protein (TIGR02246 family)